MKLLVSDYDETLTVDIATNLFYVECFRKKGYYFVIATGRNLFLMQPAISKHNIKYEYLICNDGGVIFDQNNQEIYRNDMKTTTAQKLFAFLQQFPVDDLRIDDGYRYHYQLVANINVIVFTISNEKRDYEILQMCLAKFPNIKGYMTKKSVIFMDENSDKAVGIDIINQSLQVVKENIYTIGDGINDQEMIRQYRGYYMEDYHHPQLAKITTRSVSTVAALIKQLI